MENQTHSFIVRIWQESDEEKIAWRGLIEFVGQNKKLYFYDLDSVAKFIRQQIDLDGETTESWQSRTWNWIKHEARRFRNGVGRGFKR